MQKSPVSTPLDLSVDNVVFGFDGDRLNVLLIRQGAPSLDFDESNLQMAIPGDLVGTNEDLDESARRVLNELTSLQGIYLKQFKTFGNPDRVFGLKDQAWLRVFRANPERRVVTVGYYSLVAVEEFTPSPASFAGQAKWCPIDELPTLAFDHNSIVMEAFDALKQALNIKSIAFELLPKKFTLTQLQRLHEVVLDKQLDKRNFRKNMKRLEDLVPLDEKQDGVLHKPAQLYTFRK
jgi:8-oxo-dGTP diphosphatase